MSPSAEATHVGPHTPKYHLQITQQYSQMATEMVTISSPTGATTHELRPPTGAFFICDRWIWELVSFFSYFWSYNNPYCVMQHSDICKYGWQEKPEKPQNEI